MTTHQVLITADDLAHEQSLLKNGQLSEMYDYLASKGDLYSTLAKGVVEGNTVLVRRHLNLWSVQPYSKEKIIFTPFKWINSILPR